MATATGRARHGIHRGPITGRLSRVFSFDAQRVNWPRGVMFLDVALVPLVVLRAIGYPQYLPSALFGLLFAWLADPGGSYGRRVSHTAIFSLFGAGVTALAFGIADNAWGRLTFATFAITLVAGLAVTFGARRFVMGLLLNLWFLIAIAVGSGLRHQSAHVTSHTWAQAAAWAAGAALWIAGTCSVWLLDGRRDRPQPVEEVPDDTAARRLSAAVVVFASIRALVIAGTVALAYGLNLSHGYWMSIAAIVAMRPELRQAALVSVQRLAGALIGAGVAAALLLVPTGLHGTDLIATERSLELVALVLLMHAVAIRFGNYALYCAAMAAGVLLLIDLPQPSDYGAEGYRILWTLCGVGLGVLVALLADLLGKRRRGEAAPHRTPHPERASVSHSR